MWQVIIIIAIVVIGKFFYDRHQQSLKIAKEGGMDHKYRELIAILMSADERSKIYELTSDSITVGVSGMGGFTLFILTQTFGKLTVQWKMESVIFGKHKMEWTFPEYADQQKMAERIIRECGKYQENVISSKGLSDLDNLEL